MTVSGWIRLCPMAYLVWSMRSKWTCRLWSNISVCVRLWPSRTLRTLRSAVTRGYIFRCLPNSNAPSAISVRNPISLWNCTSNRTIPIRLGSSVWRVTIRATMKRLWGSISRPASCSRGNRLTISFIIEIEYAIFHVET